MKIEINIDSSCKKCKDGLKYFNHLRKPNKNAYMQFILHPVSRFIERNRDLGEEDRIPALILHPYYNYAGQLTHFHISKEEKQSTKKEEEHG